MNKLLLLSILALAIIGVSSFKLRVNEGNDTDTSSETPVHNSTDSESAIVSDDYATEAGNSSDTWTESEYDYGHHMDEDHSIYYSNDCCTSAFSNKTYQGIHDIIGNGTVSSGEDGCWSYIYEGYNVSGCEYVFENYSDGFATDGVNHFYYLINLTHPEAVHGEMYDCYHEPRQTWGVNLDNSEENPLDNAFIIYLKEVFDMGYHYYEPDGARYMSDPTGNELWGYVYPDEHGFFNGYDDETGEYIFGESECRGAEGYYYIYTYDENGEYVEVDYEEWEYDCDVYKAHCTCALDYYSSEASLATERYGHDFHNFNDFIPGATRAQK